MADTAITKKDIDETLRQIGVAPGDASYPDHTQDEIDETLRQAGVKIAPGVVADIPKTPHVEEPPKAGLGPRGERMAREIPTSPLTPVAEGMPVVGTLPRHIAAATGAAIPASGSMPGETFESRFNQNEDVLKRSSELYDEQHPVWAPVGKFLGGTMAGMAAAPTRIGGLVMGTRGPSVGSRIYTGTAGGAGVNALDALLRGEDPYAGGMVGAGAGAAGPVVGNVAGRFMTSMGRNFMPRPGPLKGVSNLNIDRLTGAMEGETPASIAEAKRRMGPAGMLADMNTPTTDLAGGVADTPGMKGPVREAYRVQGKGQADRVEQSLTTNIAPKVDIEGFKDVIMENRANAADPLYEQWRASPVQPTQKLKDLLPRLQSVGAFKKAQELADANGEKFDQAFFTTGQGKNFPTSQSWDLTKQGLDRLINSAYKDNDKTYARALINLKNEMIREIEKTPQGQIWKQARQEFASRSELLDQIEAGKDTFLGGRSGLSVDELKHELKGLSGPALQARLQGLRAAADETMGATTRGDTTLRNKILAPNNRAKMELLLGNKRAEALINTMEQEEYLGNQRQNVVGGTQTAPKTARVKALEPPTGTEYNPNLMEPSTYLPPSWVNQMRPSRVADAWRQQRYGAAGNQLGDLLTQSGPKMEDLIAALQEHGNRVAAVGKGGEMLRRGVTGAITVPGAEETRRRYFPAHP